jgi:hypothetical protein
MKVISQRMVLRTVRVLAAVLAYTVVFNQFARAAKLPPAALALMQTTAPVKRQTPASTSSVQASEPTAQARLLAAHNIFIVDEGGDKEFPVLPSESKAQFAAAMQSWGRFHIVNNIADADLVLQLRSAVATSVVDSGDNTSSSVIYNPYFRLVIADPSTLQPLWTITTPVLTGRHGKDHTDRFTISAQNLTSQVKLLAGETLTPQETANLKLPAIHRRHVLIFGVTALAVAATVGLVLLFHFKHNGEQQQRDFCIAHNIVPCPVA